MHLESLKTLYLFILSPFRGVTSAKVHNVS
jgi:hypothetical protein